MAGGTTTVRTTNASNSWSLSFNERKRLKYLHLSYTSTATAGNRQIRIGIKDSSGNVVWDSHAGAVQAASLTYHYFVLPGIYRETSFIDSEIQVPIPVDTIIDGNHSLFVDDDAAVAAGDSMVIGYQLEDI